MRVLEKVDENSNYILLTSVVIAVSIVLSDWISSNYYFLDYLSALILFGIFHEVFYDSRADEIYGEFFKVLGFSDRTGRQIALLGMVVASIYLTRIIQGWVEGFSGPMTVVQVLSLVLILSRAYANVAVTADPGAILDGTPETYATYLTGILAFMFSEILEGVFWPGSASHIFLSVCAASLISITLLFEVVPERYLVDLQTGLSFEENPRIRT